MSADLLSSAFATFVRQRLASSSSTITPPLLPTANSPSFPDSTPSSQIHQSVPQPYFCQQNQQRSAPKDVDYPSANISSLIASRPPLKRFRYTPLHFSESGFSSLDSSPLISPVSVVSPPLNIPSTNNFEQISSLRPKAQSPPTNLSQNHSTPTFQLAQPFPTIPKPNMNRFLPQSQKFAADGKHMNEKSESSVPKSSFSVSPPQSNISLPGCSDMSVTRKANIPTKMTLRRSSPTSTLPPLSPMSCSTGLSKKHPLEPHKFLQTERVSTCHSKQTTSELVSTAKHQCPYCAVLFYSEEDLNEHKRKHERPFACSIPGCVASFSKANHLSRHIRIVHNKERPFACTEPGCGARFGSKSHLGDHTRAVHMRLRNFKCNMCDASWSKRFNLEKHIRIRHLGEKPFRCTFCYMSFGTRSHVTRHELKVHKRTQPQQM